LDGSLGLATLVVPVKITCRAAERRSARHRV